MYEVHFHLERRPFAATPDPSCCYLSPTQMPSIEAVGRCIEHGQGVAILTGPAGIGKTLLAQVLLAGAAPRFAGVYLGTGQFPTRRALLQAILYELGQSYGGMTDQELRLELNTALRNLITQRDGLLLVLDEAHLLSERLLEEVRVLADLAQHGVPLTRVVLCGNPEFEERLTAPTLTAFHQRVACHVVLETLSRPESMGYLEHRIEWAGGVVNQLFERAALQLIADASDGVPRCLNQLADHSLMQAFLAGETIVTADLVRRTLADLQHLPLRWNPSALQDRSRRQELPASTEIEEQPRRATDTMEEAVEQAESESCCFEFGAGDAEPSDRSVVFPAEHDATGDVSENSIVVAECAASAIAPVESTTSEEDDGPPLFSWLAKPVAAESTQGFGDEYCSSSFNIPARRKSRGHVVEQEMISSSPLTGSALTGKRLPDNSRQAIPDRLKSFSNASELPAEEVVVDQYASLDGRLSPVFPLPTVGFPEVSIPSNQCDQVAVPAEDFVPLEQISDSVAESVPSTSRQLEQVDALCALIDSPVVLTANGGVELITDYGVERIDVDLPAQAELLGSIPTTECEPFDIEDWIGSTVVEIGRDLQRTLATSFPDTAHQERATRIEQLLDDIERATRREYDVVEPERPAAAIEFRSAMQAVAEPSSGVVPPPKHGYKNFFSMLRRRQTR